jgi:lipid-binding SYLF domain-containing protein
MRTVTALASAFVMAAGLLWAGGCASAPKGEAQRSALDARSDGALAQMKARDPQLDNFLRNAYGYAIFPSVGKGGLIVGGGYGRGEVFEQGRFVGFADITQATLGLQAGGQTFAELIVFENKPAMDRFKYGKVKLAANASAVAIKAGAAASANYSDGVAVFTEPTGGLMFEAAVGGQEFGFVPATEAERQNWSDEQQRGTMNASAGQSAVPTTRPATNPS